MIHDDYIKEDERINKESVKSIRAAVKSVAKNFGLSDYMRRKIQKCELEMPRGWGTFPEGDNSRDACVQRYYNAVDAVYSDRASIHVYTDIVLDFLNHLEFNYGLFFGGRC